MTEVSYFYNGVGAGDAKLAPYGKIPYSILRSLPITGGEAVMNYQASGFNGAVTPVAGLTVNVAVGKAFVCGVYCSLDSPNITLPANSSLMPRIDRIVLRLRWGETPSATLGILTGIPNSVPLIPELTQIPGELFEMSLARIYIPSGLVTITAGHIIDEREFTNETASYYANENLMPNSEFMAAVGTAGTNGAVARGYPPAYWQLANTNTVIERDEKFPQMERGSTCKVTCGAVNDGMQTTLPLLAGSADIPVTIRLLIEVLKGEVWIDTAGGGANGVRVPVSVGPVEVILRRTFTAADPDLELWIYNILATETIFKLGQVTVAHGFVGAPYGITHETMIFDMKIAIVDEIFSGFATNIYVDETPTCEGISAWIMTLGAHDDASSGVPNLYVELYDWLNEVKYLRVEIGNNLDFDGSTDQGFVGVTFSTSALRWGCIGKGQGTSVPNFDASVSILGCVT